jgi:cytochrome c biogenesis protein CcdA
MKATRILLFFGIALLIAVFVIGIYVVPKAQAGSPATARQSDAARVPISDIYFDVTYATPDFIKRVKLEPYLGHYAGYAQPFLIGLNTHVGSIEHVDLKGKVLLEDNDGNRYPALGAPVVVSEHHNMYLLSFPLFDHHGKPIFASERGFFRLVVSEVGKTAVRHFTWKLPVIEPTPAKTLANALMLALGVIGALMVILSPCAIELTTYYTGIIAGIVSSSSIAERGSKMDGAMRRRILRNLAAFVAGFTLLYMASGATVSLLGQKLMKMQSVADEYCAPDAKGVSEPPPHVGGYADNRSPRREEGAADGHMSHGSIFGPWARYANWLGAAFLIYFALRSLGVLKQGGQCFVWLGRLGGKLRMAIAGIVGVFSSKRAAIIRLPAAGLRDAANITPGNSFCAGLGLSVGCLTCMGGAILYPLLIFVGTSTWYWGAMILGTYSLALAVPMAAIAISVGDMAWRWVHRPWLTRGLQWTSAVVMIFVALLIAFDRTRFINSVVFTVLSALGSNPDPTLAKL